MYFLQSTSTPHLRRNDDTRVIRLDWTPLVTMGQNYLPTMPSSFVPSTGSAPDYKIRSYQKPVSQLVSISRKNNFSNILDRVYIRSFMDLTPAGKISISDFIEVRMFYVFPREDTRLINLTVIKYLNNLSSTSDVIILNFSEAI